MLCRKRTVRKKSLFERKDKFDLEIFELELEVQDQSSQKKSGLNMNFFMGERDDI